MEPLEQARDHTILGLSQVSQFWGFPKAMGAIYGAVYLSPEPLSLDEIGERVGITKGAVSTNVRHLERLGLVHKQKPIGTRKDFYTAETDFWQVVKGILQEREKSEFDRALHTVSDSLEMVESARDLGPEEAELALFYQKRLKTLADFFKSLDNLVATVLALESLRSGAIQTLFGKKESPSSKR